MADFNFYLKYGLDGLSRGQSSWWFGTRSNLSMLLKESLDLLHVQSVVCIGVPLESWGMKVGVSMFRGVGILLILHVVMCHSWELATLPGEVADVERVVEGTEEEHAVCNQ